MQLWSQLEGKFKLFLTFIQSNAIFKATVYKIHSYSRPKSLSQIFFKSFSQNYSFTVQFIIQSCENLNNDLKKQKNKFQKEKQEKRKFSCNIPVISTNIIAKKKRKCQVKILNNRILTKFFIRTKIKKIMQIVV